MDEPLGALDRLLRRQVQSEIKRIQRSLGITVLFVTHDQDEALFLSDRIAIMNEGRIAQVGPPVELYTHPVDRFVAEFLGEPNVLSGRSGGMQDGYLSVALPGGTPLRGRPMVGSGLAERVDVLVRPERLSVSPESGPHGSANRLAARIDLVNFLGDAVELEALVDERTPLRIRMPFRSNMLRWASGDTIAISASPDDCLIFPARATS